MRRYYRLQGEVREPLRLAEVDRTCMMILCTRSSLYAWSHAREVTEALCGSNRQNAMPHQRRCSSLRSCAASIERRLQHQVQSPLGPRFRPLRISQGVCTI
jgi:hypothetical protein